jgi:hypothetical protein
LLQHLTEEHNPVLATGSAQKYLGATRDPYRCLTIAQQFTQESFILGFQSELARLPTAHHSSPMFVSADEERYHIWSGPANNSL